MNPNIKLVKEAPVPAPKPRPYDEVRGVARVNQLYFLLLISTVKYVLEGKTGTKNDRIRKASYMSGIPINTIEVASEK